MDSNLNTKTITYNLKQFYKKFWYVSKFDTLFFICAALINAILESLGLFLIWPVIAIFIDKASAANSIYGRFLSHYTPFDPKYAAIFAGVIVGGVYVVKNVVLLLCNLRETKILARWKSRISTEVYTRCLFSPLEFHNRHSFDELSGIILFGIPYIITQFVSQFFQLIANLLLCLMVVAILAYLVSPVFLGIIAFGGLTIIVSHRLFKYLNKYIGSKAQETSRIANKIISRTFQAYKEIHIYQVSKVFKNEYEDSMSHYINYEKWNRFFEQTPSLLHEIIFVAILIICMYFMADQHGSPDQAFQQLGILVVAFFRFIPSLNRISSSITMMNSACEPMQNLMNLLEDANNTISANNFKIQKIDRQAFNHGFQDNFIKIINANFSYNINSDPIIKNVNIDIQQNSLTVLVGASGAGKSTILNALMGFLPPQSGEVLINGKQLFDILDSWWNRVAIVMQDFYILNASIAENVAFGQALDKINFNKVQQVLHDAGLEDFVNNLPNGVLTVVGDNGKLLSGGQRQRLAICRALYFDKDIWILDEVTSALDLKTESMIMDMLNKFKDRVTIIMSAHRPSVFMHADHIIMVQKGEIFAQGSYEYMQNTYNEFVAFSSMIKQAEENISVEN